MNQITKITNKNKSVTIHRDDPTIIIDKRITPTGPKIILRALQEGNFEMVRRMRLPRLKRMQQFWMSMHEYLASMKLIFPFLMN